MASHYLLLQLPLLLTTFFSSASSFSFPVNASYMHPLPCSQITACNASLYHFSNGLQLGEIAKLYSVAPSQITNVSYEARQDYFITAPCSCQNNGNISGYFYETSYTVKPNETFSSISHNFFGGQAWPIEDVLYANEQIPIYLPCGCVKSDTEIVVTYSVQKYDTLSDIANLLSSRPSDIQNLNQKLLPGNSSFIGVDWVLFVPKQKNGGIPIGEADSAMALENSSKSVTIIAVLSSASFLPIVTFIIILRKRRRAHVNSLKDPKDMEAFQSKGPAVYSVKEIEQATKKFDESRIIGRGGYGCVYFGILGNQDVAIKKMISNKSKEFYAELKVLCKIHHINVVELLGYASGEDHLYLAYEFVQNGSLNDHLHDPLLKGHQPLSWSARTQIALETAKGIEYIHDHTKARYVHRDIKTSNILLDGKLRAKVADFGLVKLVERTNDEVFLATKLVGTPGYLPPEAVMEFQVTPKTDVFAFGVVLAELITGKRALFRSDQDDKAMKSLSTIIYEVFKSQEPKTALDGVVDGHLQGRYPLESVYKMAEVAAWCLRHDPIERPEMREIVISLSPIMMSSIEWEASLGGNSQVFSGVFSGR